MKVNLGGSRDRFSVIDFCVVDCRRALLGPASYHSAEQITNFFVIDFSVHCRQAEFRRMPLIGVDQASGRIFPSLIAAELSKTPCSSAPFATLH